MDTSDWRSQLQPDFRQKTVDKLAETLNMHLTSSVTEGLEQLNGIAVRFEERIYNAATSKSDYVHRIALKIQAIQSKSHGSSSNAVPSNSTEVRKNVQDPASQNMQQQLQNQDQSHPVPMAPDQSQAPQQHLAQNSMPNVGQTSSPQGFAGISQVPMESSMGQQMATNMFTNAQGQMQGRQLTQPIGTQQQSQQSQDPQQFMYHQQMQQQRGNMQPSLLQPQIQQEQHQNLLQSTEVESSQPSVMQPMVSRMQPTQQSPVQQPSQSMLQHQQSVMIQQLQPQQTQTPVVHQQQDQIAQMPPREQQLIGQQSNAAHVKRNQLIGQQGSIQVLQKQKGLMSQPNNLPNLPRQQHNTHQNIQQQHVRGQQQLANLCQQQLVLQRHVGELKQRQQLLGSVNSSMQTNQQSVHMLQNSKIPEQRTQNTFPPLPSGGQQPHLQQQQTLMPQLQSQPSQLQEQLGLQQQPNSLQYNMQRLQTSSPLFQPPNQFFPSQSAQLEAPFTSLDPSTQTGPVNFGDWQEDIYQKIQSLKETYLADVNEAYRAASFTLQQYDSLEDPDSVWKNKLRSRKQMLEDIVDFLHVPKNNITPTDRLKLLSKELLIIDVLILHKLETIVHLGRLLPQTQSLQQSQQAYTQTPQAQSHESRMDPLFQSMNVQGSFANAPLSNVPSLEQNSLLSFSGAVTAQPNMNFVHPSLSLYSGQGNLEDSMHRVPSSYLQQNQQARIDSLQSQSGFNLLQPDMKLLQSHSGVAQNQHLKQQEYQTMQKQNMPEQQQQHPQQLHRQSKPRHSVQMPQLHLMNEMNDLKLREGVGHKLGALPQHLQSGQQHQQVRPGASYNIPCARPCQIVSPQMNQGHSSPQIDQQSLMQSVSKGGTLLQSADSLYVPPPLTPLSASPMRGGIEKPTLAVSSRSNTANIAHQQPRIAPAAASSLAVGIPGISPSTVTAECTAPDANHVGASTTVLGKCDLTEQPMRRLVKAVKSMSSKALRASVSDMGSVIGMIDQTAGSAPGNGSGAAIGEDLAAMTECRVQASNYITHDWNSEIKRMRRDTSAMPLNVAPSVGTGPKASELASIATSSIKSPRTEGNDAILKEIKTINDRLIDTVVDIKDDVKGGDGHIVKYTFSPVSLSPNFKSLYASEQKLQIQPLNLLVPANYPNCSPVLLEQLPVEVIKDCEDLSLKARSRFNTSLRSLSEPMSLEDMARTWDDCARAVISDYAQQNGGGTFSSRYVKTAKISL